MTVEIDMDLDKLVGAIESATVRGLEDALDDIQIEVKNISRIDTGETSESYKTTVEVDSKNNVVHGVIGSNEMNAIWEEFGTGIYAENNDGRKTPWVYQGSDGNWYTTVGKKANMPLRRAIQNKGNNVQKHIKNAIEEEFR